MLAIIRLPPMVEIFTGKNCPTIATALTNSAGSGRLGKHQAGKDLQPCAHSTTRCAMASLSPPRPACSGSVRLGLECIPARRTLRIARKRWRWPRRQLFSRRPYCLSQLRRFHDWCRV